MFGLLWTAGPTKLVAVGVTLAVLGGAAGEGVGGLPRPAPGEPERHQRGVTAAPRQQWGTAAGSAGEKADQRRTTPANRTLPDTIQARYPKVVWDQKATNNASVRTPAAAAVRGFDEATSRELPERRSANERVYANSDGTETTQFSVDPINYRTADGTLAPIETRLIPADDPRTGWHNAAAEVDVRFAATADAPELATLGVDADHAVSFNLAGAARAAARVDGSTLTYPEVAPRVDLRLESRPSGVKETLVLKSPDTPTSYLFPLRTKGLTARLVDGQVVFTDAAGATRAVIPPGDMVDSGSGPARSTGVAYRLVTNGDERALEVTLDAAWLRSPDRTYPVLVDPSVQLPVDGGAAGSSMYVQGGSSASGGSQLLVGTVDGADSASYLKFTDLTSRLQYHTIFGAQLWTVNYDADSCKARAVSVHPVTGAWTAGSGYSYPGPAVGAALSSRSFAHGHIAFGQSSSACPTAGELFNLGVGGRDLVQRWVNGEQANNGLSLRASASDALSGKRFAGSSTANPPRLYVTHSPYNATYSIPNPSPNPVVLQNQDGKIKVTVTNKGAEAWSPGGYYLAYRLYNGKTGASVSQQRAANLTSTVARNGRVTLDATIKAMPPGLYFLDFTMVKSGGPVFTDQQVPPVRLVLEVFDIPPVVQELYPPNGYQAPTLTPQLWARAIDIDAPPKVTLQFKFEVCDRDAADKPVNCTNSGYQSKTAWTPPAGRLRWSKAYLWRAFVKDATTEVASPYTTVLTAVPQPEITSRIATAPYGAQDQEYDPASGNYTTAAVDATVATVGPELRVVRTYNSVDPRRDGLFGAGWTSRYDMKLVPDDDGSGNVVVTYPDGQAARFGRNADGSYSPPFGRQVTLTVDTSSWKLLDASGTTYQFSLNGRLNRITDVAARSVVLSYDTSTGKLLKAQVSNSQTNTAGRALNFTWSGNHVASVRTDTVGTAPLTWNYTYIGDLLSRVCGPDTNCTAYDYSAGSHYRGTVLDSRPESYWRLGEAEGTGAGSEVAVNLGKDAGTYANVTLGTASPLVGTTNTATSFNGTTSRVDLPKGTVKKARDGAVELWFKSSTTGTGGPLLGYQDKAIGSASTAGAPVLYVGTDGRLRGQFATDTISPITSAAAVNDGRWHHAVLSSMGATQTLYLDGVKAGELTGKTIEHSLLTFNQIGAAYATTPGSWPAWGSTAQRSYAGAIDEVAIYASPLGPASVTAHYRAAVGQANQLSKVTLPSGKVASTATYDVHTGRVKESTDGNGGTWKIGAPTVYGDDTDLRRSVEVLDPANRPSLYEYDALGGWVLRIGMPLGIEAREEDAPGEPTPSPPPPVQTCTKPDPNDPAFCTVIPSGSGGPVFVRYGAEGMSIRSFFYDATGGLIKVIDENGDSVTMTYDDRGNMTSQKSCRTSTECHTSYTTYPTTISNPLDPRNNLPIETRDGRSASATDNTYRTSYTYHSTGQVTSQTTPGGNVVRNTYTNGAEAAFGGGSPPAALPASSTDARGHVTTYAYYANGDLARVTEPTGFVTEYRYDAIGRQVSVKATSDAYPSGVSVGRTFDAMSRRLTETGPVTTNAVSGVKHQQRTTNTYDADGNLVAIELADVLGNDPARVTRREYDEHNRPVLITDAEGNDTTYNYDAFGNRTSETDANGNRYDYAYTARNSLAEVRLRDWRSDPEGAPGTGTGDYLVLSSYSYDFAGRQVSETDAMGRRVEHEYYGDGLLRRSVLKNFHNPNGTTRDLVVGENTYDGAGNLTRQVTDNGRLVTQRTVDPDGHLTSSVVDPGGLARTETYRYDGNGNVIQVTNSGKASNVPWAVSTTPQVVDYRYDDNDNVIEQSISDGTTRQVTSYGYDDRGLQVSATDPRGNVTGADRAAFTTTASYDELSRAVSTVGAPVAAESGGGAARTVTPTTTFGYDTFDGQTEARDASGNVSRVTYDRVGRLVNATGPSYAPPGALEPIIPVTRASYDGNGNTIQVTDAKGNVTRSTYDQLDRLVRLDEPRSTNDERATSTFTYTRTGQLLATADPTGARTEATYDDLDRQVTGTQIERLPVATSFTTRMVYDDAGNVTSAVSPSGATVVNTYDTVGALIRSTDPAGVPTEFGYDSVGRQVRSSDGLGRSQQTGYDLLGRMVTQSDLKSDGTVLRTARYGYDLAGNLVTHTDPLQVTRTYMYDAGDRLVKQVEPVTGTKSITTTFGYDAAGNRTRYTDGRGNATIVTYNSLGLAESLIEPATTAEPNPADRTWTTGYDANGNQVRLTAPGGIFRQLSYDAADQLVGETGAGAEASTSARTIGYDLAGQVTRVNADAGTNTYAYDDRGNLISTAGPSGPAQFGYDADGNLTSRVDTAGTAGYRYASGRLTSVTDGLTGATQQIGYDSAGATKSVDYGAGRKRTFGYDDLGRPSSDELKNAAGQTVTATTYGYNLADQMLRETTAGTAGAGEQTYTYDQAGRITGQTLTGSATIGYDWDDSGNRIKAGPKTASYDERNRLLADGDYTYTYSARGSLRSRTSAGLTEHFSFDAFDRLVDAAGQSYTYDGLDRVASRNGTGFRYAGLDDEIVSDGAETYARGPGDELLATGKGGTNRLSLSDQHGDVVGGFDPADSTLNKLPDSTAYDPFGKVTARSGDTGALGFQGDWTDESTGQVDMGARWYNPGTGGFSSRDDLDYSGGDSVLANRYTYGAGNPLGFVDLDGHYPTPSGELYPCESVLFCYLFAQSPLELANAIRSQASALERGAGKGKGKSSQRPRTTYPSYAPGPAASGGGGGSCGACYDPEAERRAAQQAAYQRAKNRSDAARSANAYRARNVPRAVSGQAQVPNLSGGKIVSSSPSVPAGRVSATRDGVDDARRGTDAIYQRAVQKAGSVVSNVSAAGAGSGGSGSGGDWLDQLKSIGDHFGYQDAKDCASGDLMACESTVQNVLAPGGRIGRMLIEDAVNDAVDCFTEGDWAACGWTALNVLPVGRVLSVAGKGIKYGAKSIPGLVRGGREAGGAACAAVAGSPNSFTADTQVRMADGSTKPISEVRIGDQVQATDPTTGRTGPRRVTDVITGSGQKNLTDITVDTDGETGDQTGTVTATDGHPFWVETEQRWVEARDLRPGSVVETTGQATVTVLSTHTRTRNQSVYNLTVDTVHTFYVVAGDADLLVHNIDWRCLSGVGAKIGGALRSGGSAVGGALKSGGSAVGGALKSGGSAVGGALWRGGSAVGGAAWRGGVRAVSTPRAVVRSIARTNTYQYIRLNRGRAAFRCLGVGLGPVLMSTGTTMLLLPKNRKEVAAVGAGLAMGAVGYCGFNLHHDAWPVNKPPS
ncbi:RHS repeat-associated core domain-containing protein [Micromonospora sp. NPDC047548]|uniref:RHS repeat-associated core domain-containing protein n=1 Tax=Micromonospora sp. NPDC047548 TaxID=3155624 RepID=UPI0033FFA43B